MNYIERYWRDATLEDAIKQPPMVARFRDNIDNSWSIHKLNHWDRSDDPWVNESGHGYDWCQVYDAPDPGDGWRLVDVETEKPQEGDEFFAVSSKAWCLCNEQTLRAGYARHAIIRRRIEPPKPKYVPFKWEDREQLKGRWIGRDSQEIQLVNFGNSDGFYANGVHVENLCKYWTFLDTGEPVGRKVVE